MLMDLAQLTAWIREFARVIGENDQLLTDLDSAIGDADHGINMDRGMTAVLGALDESAPADMPALCKRVGMTLVKSVGGASGPLYGTFFLRMAGALGTGESVGAADFAKALRAGVEGVVQRGRAEAGDKTMFDALAPALDALDAAIASGGGLAAALADATVAAEKGRDATESMVARKGRASYLGQRSVGHIDPGATSAARCCPPNLHSNCSTTTCASGWCCAPRHSSKAWWSRRWQRPPVRIPARSLRKRRARSPERSAISARCPQWLPRLMAALTS